MLEIVVVNLEVLRSADRLGTKACNVLEMWVRGEGSDVGNDGARLIAQQRRTKKRSAQAWKG